jgi:hypothetical protein
MMTIRPRFSIAALMGFVFVFGVGLAACRYPNKLWASLFYSITIGAMVIGSLGAVFHRGLPQKFWMGYAMCGWLYLLMNFGPWFESEVSPYLFTTAILDLIYPRVAAPEQTAMLEKNAQIIGLAGGFGGPIAPVDAWEQWTKIDSAADRWVIANSFAFDRSKPFQLIGHSLLALLFAYIGGLIARRFARLGVNPGG